MPFGFALTDPGGRISRTRLFPRVTRVISVPAPKFELCEELAARSGRSGFRTPPSSFDDSSDSAASGSGTKCVEFADRIASVKMV